MKRLRFTEEQIMGTLEEQEAACQARSFYVSHLGGAPTPPPWTKLPDDRQIQPSKTI